MSRNANDGVRYRGNHHDLNEVGLGIAELVYNDWVYRRPTRWPDFQTSDKFVLQLITSAENTILVIGIFFKRSLSLFLISFKIYYQI